MNGKTRTKNRETDTVHSKRRALVASIVRKKYFDTSGKSPAQLHHPAICNARGRVRQRHLPQFAGRVKRSDGVARTAVKQGDGFREGLTHHLIE
ncbi:hypothetical protein [Bradyrhizobium sp.]|uniref:hypothetical protein n=1 Tax=Bradyrhizobium sp. TaxID=376 RepID=UPI002722D522|nr:hypothetical protein [Bradyrhizobium sp.]MDO9297551.1 hypothetical protein [Bradyrhizobium sp.]